MGKLRNELSQYQEELIGSLQYRSQRAYEICKQTLLLNGWNIKDASEHLDDLSGMSLEERFERLENIVVRLELAIGRLQSPT